MAHPLVEAMGAAEAALEASGSAGVYTYSLRPEEVRDLLVRSQALVSRVQGRFVLPLLAEAGSRELHKFYDASSVKDLVAGWLRVNPNRAGWLVKVARQLYAGDFLATGEALARGELSVDHAGRIIDGVGKLPTDLVGPALRRTGEQILIDRARERDPAGVEELATDLYEFLDPERAKEAFIEQAERDRKRAERTRFLERRGFGVPGATELRIRCESDVIDRLIRMLEAVDATLPADAVGEEDGQARPWGVRMAHAFIELTDSYFAPDLQAHLDIELDLEPDTDDEDHDSDRDSDRDSDGDTGVQDGEDESADGDGRVGDRDGEAEEAEDTEDTDDGALFDCADLLDDTDDPDEDASGSDEMGDIGEADAGGDSEDAAAELGADDGSAGPANGGGEATVGEAGGSRKRDGRRGGASNKASRAPVQARRALLMSQVTIILRIDFDPIAREVSVARLDTGEKLSPTAAARLACNARLVPSWTTNALRPLGIAAAHRFFRGAQLIALILRDSGCVFPGCTRPLRFCHAHHIVGWKDGGPTSIDNGVLLCGEHHRTIHNGKWEVYIASDGLPEFLPPAWLDPERKPLRHQRHQRHQRW